MRPLSPAGQAAVNHIAQRHGFSLDATLSMLQSVLNGNGSMAQFNHPEFAGSGQWMRGGMTMVSDMFNQQLSNRVNNLCAELSELLASQPDLLRSGSFQSQSQGGGQPGSGQQQSSHGGGGGSGGGGDQSQGGSGFGSGFGAASLFVPGTSGDWWPPDLRHPNSTGAQNGVRYAYFAQARRLVIDVGGTVTVYDTQDHQIGGFSQQQSVGGTLGFTSQYGLVDVTSLPIISSNGQPPRASQAQNQPTHAGPGAPTSSTSAQEQDIFATIEKLAGLHAKGILSSDEFQAKKAELLSRL